MPVLIHVLLLGIGIMAAPASADAPSANASYLACYQNVARQSPWASQSDERLGQNEDFGDAVIKACEAEVAQYRPAMLEQAIATLTKVGKQSDTKLVDQLAYLYLIKTVLNDWPKVSASLGRRAAKPE